MKLRDLFFKPTPRELARRDLDEARLWLHHHVGQVEAHQAQVDMYRKRVKRLEAELKPERVEVESVAQMRDASQGVALAASSLAVVNG